MSDLTVSIEFLEFPSDMICGGENASPKITIRGLEAPSIAVMVFNPSMKDCLWSLHMADLESARTWR